MNPTKTDLLRSFLSNQVHMWATRVSPMKYCIPKSQYPILRWLFSQLHPFGWRRFPWSLIKWSECAQLLSQAAPPRWSKMSLKSHASPKRPVWSTWPSFLGHKGKKIVYLQLMPQRKSLSICGSRRGESKTTGETEGPKSRSKKMMYRLFFENKCLDNTCPINAGVLVLSTWLIWNRTVLSIVTYTQLEPEMPCASLRNSDFPLWRLHGFCRLQPPPGFPNTTWSPTGLPKHHMKSILNGCSNHQMCLVGSFSIPIYLKINQPHDWKKHEQIAWWCSCNLHIRLQCLCTTAFAKVLCGNRIFQVVVDHSP